MLASASGGCLTEAAGGLEARRPATADESHHISAALDDLRMVTSRAHRRGGNEALIASLRERLVDAEERLRDLARCPICDGDHAPPSRRDPVRTDTFHCECGIVRRAMGACGCVAHAEVDTRSCGLATSCPAGTVTGSTRSSAASC